MYGCILAPVDGSAFGEHALPLAASIARRTGSVLRIVHAHVPLIVPSGVETVAFRGAWMDVTKAEEQSYLRSLERQLRDAYGIRVESTLLDGPVADALAGYARECGAGLVVMSTHGYARFRRLWHHGIAEHLARALPLPVLLVRPPHEDAEPDLAAEPEFAHILIPLDGTPHAEAVVRHALDLGRAFRARFTLLRVVRPDPATAYSRLVQGVHLDRGLLGRDQMTAWQYLNGMAERLRASGLEVRTQVVVSDDPGGAILDFARHAVGGWLGPVDLIAMESHPHHPMARIVAAHTADRVLQGTPVPVLFMEASATLEPRPVEAPTLRA